MTDQDHQATAPGMTSGAMPGGITREVLLDVRLPQPRTIDRVEIRRISIPAGVAAGLHRHNGPVFGAIERGSAAYRIDGEDVTILAVGDVFYEPEGARIAQFDALDEGVTFLGYFPVGPGEEPVIDFPDR